MASLQIRELPADVYEALAHRAQREGRSLAQQAIVELRKMREIEARERRMDTISRLLRRLAKGERRAVQTPPETLIRRDRDR